MPASGSGAFIVVCEADEFDGCRRGAPLASWQPPGRLGSCLGCAFNQTRFNAPLNSDVPLIKIAVRSGRPIELPNCLTNKPIELSTASGAPGRSVDMWTCNEIKLAIVMI